MDDQRRARFLAWFAKRYGNSADGRRKFMADSAARGDKPYSKGRVSHFFHPDEAFGERAARGIAVRFGLDDDYFERDHGALPGHDAGKDFVELHDGEFDLIAAFRLLPPPRREHHLKAMAADAMMVLKEHGIDADIAQRLGRLASGVAPATPKATQREKAKR